MISPKRLSLAKEGALKWTDAFIYDVLDANFEVKINNMNSPFACLFDIYLGGHMHSIHDHIKSISIYKINLISTNLGTLKDP